jgi:type IV pilus assembly protein PilV
MYRIAMKTFSFASSHRQRGFSLLEVLISVLIFSIGLMGLAGLQVVGMKANQNALLRSIASEAAYDMLDQLRAQPKGTTKVGDWNSALAALLPSGEGKVCVSKEADVSKCSAWEDEEVKDPAGDSPSEVFLHVQVIWKQASVNADGFADVEDADAENDEQEIIVTGQL